MSVHPEPFSCETLQEGGATVVRPAGEIDLQTAPQVASALAEALRGGGPSVVLDLTGVTFLDSSGLRAALSADAEAREAGIEFSIVRGGPMIHRVFEVAGLTDHLRFA